jgi:hypothetical protein
MGVFETFRIFRGCGVDIVAKGSMSARETEGVPRDKRL